MQKASDSINSLLESVLNFRRLLEHKLTLTKSYITSSDFIKSNVEHLKFELSKHGEDIEFIQQLDIGFLPHTIFIDHNRVKYVLENLKNIITFSSKKIFFGIKYLSSENELQFEFSSSKSHSFELLPDLIEIDFVLNSANLVLFNCRSIVKLFDGSFYQLKYLNNVTGYAFTIKLCSSSSSTKPNSPSTPSSPLDLFSLKFTDPKLENQFYLDTSLQVRNSISNFLSYQMCSIFSILFIFYCTQFYYPEYEVFSRFYFYIFCSLIILKISFLRFHFIEPWYIHILILFHTYFTGVNITSHVHVVLVLQATIPHILLSSSGASNFLLAAVCQCIDFFILQIIFWHNGFIKNFFIFNFAWLVLIIFTIALLYLIQEKSRLLWHTEYLLKLANAREYKVRKSLEEMLLFIRREIQDPQDLLDASSKSLLQEFESTSSFFKSEHINMIEIIQNSCKFVAYLLEDSLNFNSIQDGAVILNLTPMYLRKFASSLHKDMIFNAKRYGIHFDIDYDEKLPSIVLADSYRLLQVLYNFLNNSFKFTRVGGSINLSISLVDEITNNFANVKFSVRDTGIGISDDDQNNLFKMFSQINPSEFQSGKGMGLGVYISKSLVQLHGGECGLISELGVGSDFYFTIPFEIPQGPVDISVFSHSTDFTITKQISASEKTHIPSSDAILKCKVLVAEDNLFIQSILSKLLISLNISPTFVENGRDGVDFIINNPETFKFAIFDMHMPVMSGSDAIAEIRSKGIQIPIIGLTGDDNEDSESLFLSKGAQIVLKKPVKRNILYDAIKKLLSSQNK